MNTRGSNDDKFFDRLPKLIVGVWVVSAILSVSLVGVVIWAIVELVKANT